MANYMAISNPEFVKKSWQVSPNYLFASKDSICPLVTAELSDAMMRMPIAFIRSDGIYSLIGIQGLEESTNSFLAPDGRWLASYIPLAYRSYPFAMASTKEKEGELILCIDTDSGLLISDDTAEPFFDLSGGLAPDLEEIFESLSHLETNRKKTELICERLAENNLFRRWELKTQVGDIIKDIGGLFCIDEKALNGLSEEAFTELRIAGAIPAVYSQLFSMRNISVFSSLAKQKADSIQSLDSGQLNLESLNSDESLNFENF